MNFSKKNNGYYVTTTKRELYFFEIFIYDCLSLYNLIKLINN